MEQQTKELIDAITNWHANRMRSLQAAIDAPDDADIKLGAGDDAVTVPGGSDLAKGMRWGILLAKDMFANLPFTVSPADEDEGEDD